MAYNPFTHQNDPNYDPENWQSYGNPFAPPPPAAPQNALAPGVSPLPYGTNTTRYAVPGSKDTTAVIDPTTLLPIDLTGLKEGQNAGEATLLHGFALDKLSDQRSQPIYQNIQQGLNDIIKTGGVDDEQLRLMFATGADQASVDQLSAARQLRSTLGTRGILPTSGVAANYAARINATRNAATRGTERDVRVEALKQKALNRANAYAQMLNLGKAQSEVPTYGNDALTGLTELIIQKKALDAAAKQGKKSSSNSVFGSILNAAANIIPAVLPKL